MQVLFLRMRYHSYLNSAKKIIESNWGDIPFAQFLKKFFTENKKYGSRDRKQVTALCYNFYRLGKALPYMPVTEKIIAAVFLCEHTHNEFLQFHKPEWNEVITKPAEEKSAILGIDPHDVFPWADELSPAVDFKSFCFSFFIQPNLFLRIRGNKENVERKLLDAGLQFENTRNKCIALPNGSKIDAILEIDKEVVIQDLNSQHVLDHLATVNLQLPVKTWDCCAASGGKSILAFDLLQGQVDLAVSDIRESILRNLANRFKKAGITNYRSFVADLSKGDQEPPVQKCQLIICDAPCTGSGTWSRTPEQLFFFNRSSIDVYAQKQQKIVRQAITKLQKGGIFIYITCSVFKKENEDIVNFIKEKFHLQLLQMELLKGYDQKADSMFTAVFLRP
jgi:16S rRNA (cytosine967-C5)-methyltransferase